MAKSPPASCSTITREDMGNNESRATGIACTPQGYLALTSVGSRWFRTRKGAEKYMAKWGYNPDGTRAR